MSTSTNKPCSECGKPVAQGALLGLCPECLMKAGPASAGEATTQLAPEPLVERPETREFAPGTRLGYFGDYELLEEIARGGMGVVYKARQLSLKRIVAVKMIRSGALADATEVARFRAEAQAAAQLQHPNIVAIHEIGEHEGRQYFSMDFVEGKNLAQIVGSRPVAPQQAAEWLKAMAGALQFAHQHGVLHRDLKPQNIMVDAVGVPRVTDFGLAKNIAGDSTLTQTGAVMGSPSYMSPEQARGRNDLVGPASDVYALGAILYELLTGRPPFRGKTPLETLSEVVNDEPRPPRSWNPNAPVDLATICLKCLEKEPLRRYPTARELELDLGRFLAGEPVQARPAGGLRKLRSWSRRHRSEFNVAVSVVILTLVALAYGLWEQTRYLSWLVAHPGSVRNLGERADAFWRLLGLEWLLFLLFFPVVKLGYQRVTTGAPWKKIGMWTFDPLRESMGRPASFGVAVGFGAASVVGVGLALYVAALDISAAVWERSALFYNLVVVYPLFWWWFSMLLEIVRQQQRKPVGAEAESEEAALTDEQLAAVGAVLAAGNVWRAARHYRAATRAPLDEAQTRVLEMAAKRLPAEQLGAIEREIFAGHIVRAARLFRAATRVQKRFAYLFVRRMKWKLYEAHPEKFCDAKLAWTKANGVRFAGLWAGTLFLLVLWMSLRWTAAGPRLLCLVLGMGGGVFVRLVNWKVEYHIMPLATRVAVWLFLFVIGFIFLVSVLNVNYAPVAGLALELGLIIGWLVMHLRLRKRKVS